MYNEKILVVDDEQNIIELIKFNLKNIGYSIITANNGIDAFELAKIEKPNLILLDLMLPKLNGFEVCKKIRKDENINLIPIIMITAKNEENDKILGLEIGADDYITKPFSIKELIARVNAILRRSSREIIKDKNFYSIGNLQINFKKYEVLKNSQKIDLTLKEFELLEMLIKARGNVLTREFLLEKIWGYEYIGETRTVDVHIRHLRKKIEDNDKNPIYIQTIRGIGYKFFFRE